MLLGIIVGNWTEDGYQDLEEGEPMSKPSLPDHYVLKGSASRNPTHHRSGSTHQPEERNESIAGLTAYLPSSKVPVPTPPVLEVDAGHAVGCTKPRRLPGVVLPHH